MWINLQTQSDESGTCGSRSGRVAASSSVQCWWWARDLRDESDPCTVASRTLSLVIVDRCCPGMYPCFPRVDNGVRNMVGYDDHLSAK
jgi:hypothetical protein